MPGTRVRLSAGLSTSFVPSIHVFTLFQNVDSRAKPGHDDSSHCLRLAQLRNFIIRETKFLQHLVGVLTLFRRRRDDFARRA